MKWRIVRIIIIIVLAFQFQLLGIRLPGQLESYVMASNSADVVVRVTPFIGLAIAPTGFTVTRITDKLIRLDWTPSENTTVILAKVDGLPTGPTDGYIVYTGNGTTTNDTFTNLDIIGGKVFYAAYSVNATGGYSPSAATGWVEGAGMTLLALALLATALTVAMFLSKNAMLGFPSAIMWAILGVYAYTESAIPWGDYQFYLAFSSLLGMTTFCMYGAYGLREKKDTLADESMDEDSKETNGAIQYVDEENGNGHKDEFASANTQQSKRIQGIRARARNRRVRRALLKP